MDKQVAQLRLLLLEDVPSDAELVEVELRDAGLEFTVLRVDTRVAFEQALDQFKPDIILADYRLPAYSGRDALEYTRRTYPQIPVIMVTGALGDEAAVELLKLGARDYVLKGSMARLTAVVNRALFEEQGIRKRKQAEQELAESELQYRRLFEAAKDGILILDAETGKIIEANPYILDLLSYSLNECIGKTLWDIGIFADTEDSKLAFKELQSQGHIRYEDLPLEAKGGHRRDVEFVSNIYAVGNRTVIQCNIRDITERKLAEAALHESEQKFQAIFDHIRDGILVMNIEEHSVFLANVSIEQMLGYGPGELIGLPFSRLHPPELLMQIREQFDNAVRGGQQAIPDLCMQTRDGRIVYTDLSGAPVDIGDQHYMLGAFRDATERRAGEQALLRVNRSLRTLSAGNMALVRSANEDELLQAVTSVIVEQGGYKLAIVGYAEDDTAKSITLKAWSNVENGYFSREQLSWDDRKENQFPLAKAIFSGTTQISNDIVNDPAFRPWQDDILAHGYKTNIALPLTGGGRTFGSLCIYSSNADAFDKEEVRLLEELADDLAYGIESLRTRAAQEQHTRILHESLEQSIQTIAYTVEARDPYTAGHQQRVAELATAIALEMGLPEEQIKAIHLAAIIHDLGKIRVPAEILSKPSKLSNIEFMLIKEHPQAGYDILKDVKFPWPIANIVLQHHERQDGSGYPRGLKGDAILLEARILCVADVVEAMSSHRPYRPGLGIDAALDEIGSNRDLKYDPKVVDACIKLFRERGYKLTT